MKLTESETKEFHYLEEWCITLMDYFDKIEPNEYSWRNSWPKMQATKKWLKGLRMAFNDLNQGTQDLSFKQYKELNKLLKNKFGNDLLDIDKRLQKKIQSFIKKGKISNKEQYYLLREYFERIWDMPEYKETAKKIEDILFTFEKIKI